MTPADERISALLAKWRKSLDLHARYTELTDDQYWLVQPWPEHQRPNRWIVDLASQRLGELERIFQMRVSAGDPSLSEALELMGFLANLVGSQHVQRFVPMAEPEQQRPIESLTIQQSRTASSKPAPPPPGDPRRAFAVQDPAASRHIAPASEAANDAEPGSTPPDAAGPHDEEVIRDAVRLLSWGREWHELPNAIARISGRPGGTVVRQILKSHRDVIEQRALELAASR
jgi:hypothetical protein